MQVTFKLTPSQELKAVAKMAKLRQEHEKIMATEPNDCWGRRKFLNPLVGTLDGWQNDAQCLTVENGVLTYTGQRCPMVADGSLDAIKAILGVDDVTQVTPSSYETSDDRLRWYETLESYIESRGTLADYVECWETGKGRIYYTKKFMGEVARKFRVPISGTPAALRAQYARDELALVERMVKLFQTAH